MNFIRESPPQRISVDPIELLIASLDAWYRQGDKTRYDTPEAQRVKAIVIKLAEQLAEEELSPDGSLFGDAQQDYLDDLYESGAV